MRTLKLLLLTLVISLLPNGLHAGVVNATFNSATDIPVTAASYTATGNTVNFTLNFAPPTGTALTVVNNTGLPFIAGAFGNLAQGQQVALTYGGISYDFVANYFGGSGNDLILQWARTRLVAWGDNSYGKLGDGTSTDRSLPTAVTASGALNGKVVLKTAIGPNHCLALCSDGAVLAWGYNNYGQLGNASTTSSSVPVEVRMSGVLLGKTVVALAVGGTHSLALCADGTVAAWGYNYYGQLGNNGTGSSSVPVLVDASGALAGKTVVAIAAGDSFSAALCSNGTVVTWGYNYSGQLGNGTTTTSLVPIAVATSGVLSGKTVRSIVAGGSYCLVIASDGKVVGWGENSSNQLGNGTSTNALSPVAVTSTGALSGKTITGIGAGSSHSVAVCSDGTLATWGYNYYGQLGNNSTNSASAPTAVTVTSVLTGKYPVSVGVGLAHTIALCSDGTLAAWGYNSSGQLGTGNTTTSLAPTAVSTSTLAAGERFIAATTRDGDNNLAVVAGPSNNADLASLLPSEGALSPAFASGTISYTTTVPFTAATITLTPTVADTTAEVTIGGTAVPSGTASNAIPLNVGNNTISVLVTAQNGTTKTYTVVVTRTELVATAAASSLASTSATLNGIVNANGLSTTATFQYGLTTAYGSTIDAIQSPITATESTPVSASIGGLTPGTTYHYRLTGTNSVGTRNGVDMTFIAASNNANLSALALGTGTLSPSFSTGVLDYTASVSNTTTTITVRPTLGDTTATVKVNGIAVASGSFCSPIALAIGPNVIRAVTTAQDGVTTITYTITVTRVSVNSDLAALATSSGTLSPAFQTNTTAYALSVPYAITGMSVTPTGGDVWAAVKVNGATTASGVPSANIPLAVGTSTITVLVTAQSGASKTYTLTVTRQPLSATYASGSDVPVTVAGLTATGNTATLALGYEPAPGTELTVVSNTGTAPIGGSFSNLTQGQLVSLTYGGVIYQFVANYYGGTGNDLVLHWANTRLVAWGANESGQLGDNGRTDQFAPNQVTRTGALAGKSITAWTAGANHSIALCSDGTLVTWGDNTYGQIGNGTTTGSLVPVLISNTGVLAGKTVVGIAAGQYHNLALCSDGTLVAWGYNYYGQLGNGTTTQSGVPVAVNKSGVLSGKLLIGVSAGVYHSLVLCGDGTVAAWGYNGNGELGNGGTGFSTLPVAVDMSGVLVGKGISAISAGSFHNIALATDGTFVGWGYNGYGQLGDGSTNSSSVPVRVDVSGALYGKAIRSIAAGYYHSLALCGDGTVAAWGYNGEGELGDGTDVASSMPVTVDSGGALAGRLVTGIATGAMHSLASCADGTLVSWGFNSNGQLGNGVSGGSGVPQPVISSALAAGERFVSGRSGPSSLHSLALVGSPPPPIITTLAATAVTATGATLNGTVNPNGSSTTPSFDYGPTNAYGSTVAGVPAVVTGTGAAQVAAAVSGLTPGTTYHYRLTGTSAGGMVRSADVIFTTAGYNANLSGLVLSAGQLSPAFTSETTSYTANVPGTISTITLTPTVASQGSTVKVNGAAVVSGSSSMPVFLMPGLNTISSVVTAQDGLSTRTYTVAVTRLAAAPEIAVERNGVNLSAGSSVNFGPGSAGRSASVTFVIKNTGNANLTGLQITKDGPDAAMFDVTAAPAAPVSGPAGSTTFTVTFSPAGSGSKAATIHIASNDSDENPFDLNLSGVGLSTAQDTDGDGLNDAAEFQMEALGFDWQTSQVPLVNNYFNNAGAGGLYTQSQLQALAVDAPLLAQDPATGTFKLTLGVYKSLDLEHYSILPMTAPSVVILPDGTLEFRFTSPDNAAFFRVEAR